MLNLHYDKVSDTLYIKVGNNFNQYCSEVINQVNVFRDLVTDELVGYTIFAFKEKYHNNVLPPLPFNNEIDYKKDIIPLL